MSEYFTNDHIKGYIVGAIILGLYYWLMRWTCRSSQKRTQEIVDGVKSRGAIVPIEGRVWVPDKPIINGLRCNTYYASWTEHSHREGTTHGVNIKFIPDVPNIETPFPPTLPPL